MDKTRILLTWLLFTVVFGLAPIAVSWIYLRTIPGPAARISLESLLGKGELFLIATLISTDALGRLLSGFPSNRLLRLGAIVAGAGCIGVAFWSSVEFALLVPRLLNEAVGTAPGTYNVSVVVHDSLLAFALSIVFGFGVIIILEG
jgi:hypothetical protein